MSIWQFQRLLSQRLLAWNILNFTTGLILLLNKSRFLQGVGSQFAGWAVINAMIALFGQNAAEKRRAKLDDSETVARRIKEAGNLRTLLWMNAGLDVLYMLGGWRLFTRKASSGRMRGIGLGILFQGAFLFIFDITQAQQVPAQNAHESAQRT